MSPAPFTGQYDPVLLFALGRLRTLDRMFLLGAKRRRPLL